MPVTALIYNITYIIPTEFQRMYLYIYFIDILYGNDLTLITRLKKDRLNKANVNRGKVTAIEAISIKCFY